MYTTSPQRSTTLQFTVCQPIATQENLTAGGLQSVASICVSSRARRCPSEGTQQGPATWQSYTEDTPQDTILFEHLTVLQIHRSNKKNSQGPTPPHFPAARQVAPCLRQSELRSQLSPCGTSGGHRFSPVLSFSPVSIIPPVLHTQPQTVHNHSSLQRR
jgi:hypothetical protein